MDKEQMKVAILKQEQVFRQQVNELHRLYHVQNQLTRRMPATASNRAPAIIDFEPKPQPDILHSEKSTNPQQFLRFASSKVAISPAPAPEPEEECSLELTLATGPSSSSDAGTQKAKRVKSSSNSDSGTTAVSSTSTDSELAQFREVDVTTMAARFQSESRRMDGMGQGAWTYQCLSLKTA